MGVGLGYALGGAARGTMVPRGVAPSLPAPGLSPEEEAHRRQVWDQQNQLFELNKRTAELGLQGRELQTQALPGELKQKSELTGLQIQGAQAQANTAKMVQEVQEMETALAKLGQEGKKRIQNLTQKKAIADLEGQIRAGQVGAMYRAHSLGDSRAAAKMYNTMSQAKGNNAADMSTVRDASGEWLVPLDKDGNQLMDGGKPVRLSLDALKRLYGPPEKWQAVTGGAIEQGSGEFKPNASQFERDMADISQKIRAHGPQKAGEVTMIDGPRGERLVVEYKSPTVVQLYELGPGGKQTPYGDTIDLNQIQGFGLGAAAGKWKNFGTEGIYNEALGPGSLVTMERMGLGSKEDKQRTTKIFNTMWAANEKQWAAEKKSPEQVLQDAINMSLAIKRGEVTGLGGGTEAKTGAPTYRNPDAQEYYQFLKKQYQGTRTDEQIRQRVLEQYPNEAVSTGNGLISDYGGLR